MTEWAKQQYRAREEDRDEFQRKHADFKKDNLDLEQILSGAADKKQENETMESENQVQETRDMKKAKYTHSVRANIHGLEDMNLTPPIDCDFLNVLLEMPTSEQRQVIEKAQKILIDSSDDKEAANLQKIELN